MSLLVLAGACADPPKPEKAKDLDKIEPKDAEGSESSLGPIPDGPIAKVGDVEIPSKQFREIYDLKIKKYTDRGREVQPSADRRYRKSIAERLIYHEVLRQEAEALGVAYDPAELARREEEQRRGIREWDKHLGRRGETDESLREMYIAELRERAILEKLGKLSVTPEEIEDDYQKIKGNWKSDKPRIKAAHILVPVGPGGERLPTTAPIEGRNPHEGATEAKAETKAPEPTDAEKAQWEKEAKAKADELYALVTAPGADFSKIAGENSTGPSAAKGGYIGIITADRMAEEFSEEAFSLKPGEISKPVKTKFGYHIIKVLGQWPPGELPKEALEDQIIDRLSQRKLHQGRRELKDDLLRKYTIVDNIKDTLGPEPERGGRLKPAERKAALERRRAALREEEEEGETPHGALVHPHGASPHGPNEGGGGEVKGVPEPPPENEG